MLELGLLIVCNAGILAVWILATISALSPRHQQGKRERKYDD